MHLQNQDAHGGQVQTAGLGGVFILRSRGAVRAPTVVNIFAARSAVRFLLMRDDFRGHAVIPGFPRISTQIVQHMTSVVPGVNVSMAGRPFWCVRRCGQIGDSFQEGRVIICPAEELSTQQPLGGHGGRDTTGGIGRHVFVAGAVSAVLSFVEIKDRASGGFEIRSVVRAELRAQVVGFLREVYYDEGDRVSPGMLVVRLEVPNLDSRITQKRAEVQEIEAKLRLLDAGPRPEEVLEQRHRVHRAREWRDLARRELAQARLVLKEELERLDGLIAQCEAELEFAQDTLQRTEKLLAKNAFTENDYLDAKKKFRVCRSKCRQAQAEKRARQAVGTLEAEVELARRENEQAEAVSTLTLLEAGTRPEEIEAAQAHLARLQEELRYSEGLQEKLLIHSPTSGLVVTPRVKEKVGQYFEEGDLICEIEAPAVLEAQIILSEQ